MAPPARIGPYQVVRELGRGGMGLVLEVRHPDVPRPLALKLILGAEADEEASARFRREAELMARVQHPGVVKVHTVGQAPEGAYLVCELVEGESLAARARRGPLEAREAARLVRHLADAVRALHAAGVLHRDLKPHNVIVRPDGAPVLLDFGVARDAAARERLTRTGVVVGTPAYMAPEQADGTPSRELDERADVYGLGAVLFELLAGRPPFDEASGEAALLKRVLFDEPRWPSTTRADVPPHLEAVVRVAMAKQRVARHRDAGALRDDLDRFLRGERPLAAGQLTRAHRRRALALGAAVGLAAVAVTAAGFLAWRALTPRAADVEAAAATSAGTLTPTRAAAPSDAARRATWERRYEGVGTRERARGLRRWLAAHPSDEDAPIVRALLAGTRAHAPLELFADAEARRSGALGVDTAQAARLGRAGPLVVAFSGRQLCLFDLAGDLPEVVLEYEYDHPVPIHTVLPRGSARFVVVPEDGWLREYALDGRQPVSRRQARTPFDVTACAGSPEGWIALGGRGRGADEVQVIVDLDQAEAPLRLAAHEGLSEVRGLAFSSDGRTLAIVSGVGFGSVEGGNELRVWSLSSPPRPVEPTMRLNVGPTSVAAAPGGGWLVGFVEGLLRRHDPDGAPLELVLDARDARPVQELADPAWIAHSSDVSAISRSGHLVITASAGQNKSDPANPRWNELRAWRLDADRATGLRLGEDDGVRRGPRPYASLALTPDGALLLAGTSRGVVEVWLAPR